MNSPPFPLILASTSARRKAILQLLNLPFETISPPFEEQNQPHLSPAEEALYFAHKKAEVVAQKFPNHWVVGSDTLIEWKDEKIGKPKDMDEARQILGKLQGGTHFIWTALAILHREKKVTDEAIEKVEVKMKPLSDEEILNYLEQDQPLDKAGAYAIQENGNRLIETIKGDYFAAVGFPLRAFEEILQRNKTKITKEHPLEG